MTQQEGKNPRGAGLPVEAYVEDAQSLSPEEFEDRHGSAFLLLTAAEVGPPAGPAATIVEVHSLADEDSESTGSVSLVAFPVRRGSESVTHLVTVGRTSNNDIAISDFSVSRFHAFLKQDADGTFQVLDGGSTNGTRVNGAMVPARGEGSPTSLKSGDTLRLGRVEFTFLDATSLHSFALKHGN